MSFLSLGSFCSKAPRPICEGEVDAREHRQVEEHVAPHDPAVGEARRRLGHEAADAEEVEERTGIACGVSGGWGRSPSFCPPTPFPQVALLHERLSENILQGEEIDSIGEVSSDFTDFERCLKPVAFSTDATNKVVGQILKMDYYAKQGEWLRTAQTEQSKLYALGAIVDKAALAQLEQMLLSDLEVGRNIRAKPKMQAGQFETIFEPIFNDHLEGQSAMVVTHMCCSEARLILQGCEVLCGWKYVDIPGASFSQKTSVLGSYTIEKAVNLAAKSGFVRELRAGTLMIVPAGYLVASITGKGGSSFLRWCLASQVPDATKLECAAAHTMLQNLISAYPSMRSKLHKSWLAHLELDQ